LVIALILTRTVYGQFSTETVFYTGEHFKKDECRIETYPDWGCMILLSNTRFYSTNFNKGKHNRDTMALIGNYRVSNDTLYLTSIKFAVQFANWLSRDTVDFETNADYEWMKKSYPDIKFKITKCEDGEVLLVGYPDNRFWYARKDPDGHRQIERMKSEGQWEYLLR
jgi:hypothetical protein